MSFNWFSNSTATAQTVADSKKIENLDLADNKITYQHIEDKTCKVAIDCENAKRLINVMKYSLTNINSTVETKTVEELNALKEKITKTDINNINIQDLSKQFDALKNTYSSTQKQVADQLKKDQTEFKEKSTGFAKTAEPIKVEVFTKTSGQIFTVTGTIKSFNLSKKTVNVSFTNKNGKAETITDLPITKICIKDNNCTIEIGSGQVTTTTKTG